MLGYGDFDTVMNVVAEAVEPGPYLMGEQFTAADVVVGSTLRWGMMFGLLPKRPEFIAYVGRLEQRPALQAGHRSRSGACRGLAAEGLAAAGLGLIELGALLDGEVVAGAIDVEIEHRHRRAIRIVAVAGGILRRFLQRGGDLLRRAVGEQTRLELERMIVSGHVRRPFLA